MCFPYIGFSVGHGGKKRKLRFLRPSGKAALLVFDDDGESDSEWSDECKQKPVRVAGQDQVMQRHKLSGKVLTVNSDPCLSVFSECHSLPFIFPECAFKGPTWCFLQVLF